MSRRNGSTIWTTEDAAVFRESLGLPKGSSASAHSGRAKGAVGTRALSIEAALRELGMRASAQMLLEFLEDEKLVETDARDDDLVLRWLNEGEPGDGDSTKRPEMKWRSFQDAVRKAKARLRSRDV